jgi:hypothetical protein
MLVSLGLEIYSVLPGARDLKKALAICSTSAE